MIRLLIVDDEPYTVDGLAEMLGEVEELELEIVKAYTSQDAVERMSRTKMDIVLSDIRMPGMDGLELQRWILAHWPRCKVIFLSGMGDFQYIQHAIRHGGADYILKTEGDEAILRAIRQAVRVIGEESLNEQFLLRAKEQLWQAMPLLRRDWFHGLLDPRGFRANRSPARLQELGVSLRSDLPVLLITGRVDLWKEEDQGSTQTLLLYAIQNIAEEYLAPTALMPIILDGSHFVWLIQPRGSETNTEAVWEERWRDVTRFALGTLDSIQETCKKLLRLPVSLVTNGSPMAWERLSWVYSQLKQTMVIGLGDGREMLITYCETEHGEASVDAAERRLAELEQALESGRQEEWEALVDGMFSGGFGSYADYSEAYYSAALLLLRQMNAAMGPVPEGDELRRLMDLNSHASRESAAGILKEYAAKLIERRQKTVDERTYRILQKLNAYIRDHLSEDLSLDALASLVYLNSSYLSSLYKQCAGMNLSEYITELRMNKAKELLAGSQLKIHEIASQVGIGTAGYFSRFFKKHTGITPQEYRAIHEK